MALTGWGLGFLSPPEITIFSCVPVCTWLFTELYTSLLRIVWICGAGWSDCVFEVWFLPVFSLISLGLLWSECGHYALLSCSSRSSGSQNNTSQKPQYQPQSLEFLEYMAHMQPWDKYVMINCAIHGLSIKWFINKNSKTVI